MKTITYEELLKEANDATERVYGRFPERASAFKLGFIDGAEWVMEHAEDKHQITPQAIEDMGLECIMNDVYCIYTLRTDDASIQISRDYNSQLWSLSVIKGNYIVSIPIETIEDIETIFFMLDIDL